jgi:hypothetical protein
VAGDGVGVLAGDGVGLFAGDGVGLLAGDGVGLLAGDGVGLLPGDGDGVLEGDGVGHAVGLEVTGMFGTATGPGPWLAKNRASGTMIMPTMTASTKVTAPHSRLTKAQFTSREL